MHVRCRWPTTSTVAALHIYDRREESLPPVGLIRVKDAETGRERWVDTSSRKVRESYAMKWTSHVDMMNEIFARSGVDHASIRTGEDYVRPLMALFKRR